MIRYERKIAESALPPVRGASPDPTGEQKGGTLTIGGGQFELAKEPHKDWGQVIAKDLEIPANFHTMRYEAVVQSTVSVPVGEVGHMSVKASGNVSIAVKKPAAVPEEMWLPGDSVPADGDRHRYRVFSTTLYVYYAGPSQLSLSGDIQYGFDGYKLTHTPVAPPPDPDPDAEPTPEYALEKLFKHYTEEQREAGTADLFLLTYDERIGRAIITPLALAQPNAADPTTPHDKDEEPEDPEEDEDGPNDLENDYVDENGNPLVEAPPPPRPGSPLVICLHPNGISVSDNGGANWDYKQVAAATGPLIDIAGTESQGVWLLCEDGTTLYAPDPRDTFIKRSVGDGRATEVEMSLINPGFENPDLEGSWALKSGTQPVSLDIEDPPQREGSSRYLVSAGPGQPFRIEQPLNLPDSVRAEFAAIGATDARVEADVFLDPGAEATVMIGKPYTYIRAITNMLGMQFGSLINGRYEDLHVDIAGGDWTQFYLYPIDGSMSTSGGYGDLQLNRFTPGAEMRIGWGNVADNMVFRLTDVDEGQIVRFKKSDVLDYRVQAGKVSAVEDGDYIEFHGAAENSPVLVYSSGECWVDLCVRKGAVFVTSGDDMRFMGSPWTPSGTFGQFNAIGTGTLTGAQPDAAETDHKKRWQKIQFEFPLDSLAAEGFFIALEGKGEGSVYYDNVRIYAGQAAAPIKAIATSFADRLVDFYDSKTHWTEKNKIWTGNPEIQLEPVMAAGGESGSDFLRAIATGSAVSVQKGVVWSHAISVPEGAGSITGISLVSLTFRLPPPDPTDDDPPEDPGYIGGPYVLTTAGEVLHFNKQYQLTSSKKYDEPVSMVNDPRREWALLTQNAGAVEGMKFQGAELTFASQKPQPINSNVVRRRTFATQRGMLFGYSLDSADLFWTDAPTNTWRAYGSMGARADEPVEPEQPPEEDIEEPPAEEPAEEPETEDENGEDTGSKYPILRMIELR